jgi:REP element-mobilizing transposase RayT
MTGRKYLRRFYEAGLIYFITTSTKDRFPYFKESIFCELLAFEIELASHLKNFETYGYVIMPDHLHLLVQLMGDYNISKIVQFIKRNSSRSIKRILNRNSVEYTVREIAQSPLREGRITSSDINRRIEDFESHLSELRSKFYKKHSLSCITAIPEFKWHKSFYDHILRDNENIGDYYEYIINNLLKHSLTENPYDYRWIYIKESDDFIKQIDLDKLQKL